MSPLTVVALMELISKAVAIGGEILPIALKAYEAIKAESEMSDEELIAEAATLNAADRRKLADFIAGLE